MSMNTYSMVSPVDTAAPRVEDDSDDNRSTASSAAESENEGDLYVSSTISRDETSRKGSKQQGRLSKLNNQSARGSFHLNNFTSSSLTPSRPPSHLFSSARNPIPPQGVMPAIIPVSAQRRLPTIMPTVPQGGYPPGPRQTVAYRKGGIPHQMHEYPTSKVSKNAEWRRKLMKDRGILPDSDEGDSEQDDTPQLQKNPKTDKGEVSNEDSLNTEIPSLIYGKASTTNVSLAPLENLPAGKKNTLDLGKYQSIESRSDVSGKQVEFPSSNIDPHIRSTSKDDEPDKKNPGLPGLAESLSNVSEKYLGVDVLDRTQEVSQFISYLLDTVQMLENKVRYLQAEDDNSSDTSPDIEDRVNIPCGRIIHRVYCSSSFHAHDRVIYEDEPVFRGSSFGGQGGLVGKVQIGNIGTYLNRHLDISFLIIREHSCAESKTVYQYRRQGNRGNNRSLQSTRGERLRIVSPLLQKALAQVAEFHIYPEAYQNTGELDDEMEVLPETGMPYEMDAPYPFLFHHRQKLMELAEQPTYKEVITPLLKFLDENYNSEYEEVENLFGKGCVNAYHISMLFKPNQMVIDRRNPDVLEAYVLSTYATLEKEKINFRGWSWQYDGTVLQRRQWKKAINAIADEPTRISDLVIHPIEFARSEDIQRLETRGKKFWDMKGQVYTCYSGWDRGRERYYTNTRFMVDVATHELMHKKTPVGYMANVEPSRLDTWPCKIDRRNELPPRAALLLPATIYGFDLRAKRWVNLFVEQFHELAWNKKAFDRLVLDRGIKDMIYALVNEQTSAKKMDDIITGKGNGLIVLLHGSPGTGKTLTAESVAEIAEKPLYRVTCGDIGTDAPDVEKYLETVLYLGKIWDCVLLLDEADVFLEERTMADLQRNSLVSVFLRILEYYEGILILTSNRVGTFDEAFKSRIQVAIHYDNLTKKSRKAIWSNFLEMIEGSNEEDANIPELERRLDELAAEEINGRQIRNAVLTARQLAKHRGERLDWPHLSQVMKTSASFNKYLKTVRGHSDDQWAREEMLR
ncbi:hypothetical protein F5Y04DRAFT_155426 [Hypomontagnella monticulosa]|nr:hypothetical protein F5Y04DRAFT_155426 [Hypomontagnella monticulosa]